MKFPHYHLPVLVGCLFYLCVSSPSVCGASLTSPVQLAEDALNKGDLPTAERLLRSAVADAVGRGLPLEEAIARRWLGVALAHSGIARMNEATNELRRAVTLLDPLAKTGDKKARTALGFSLFDLAETLRTCAGVQLREQRLIGATPSGYFALIRDCIAPAEEAMRKAAETYPSDRIADLDYANGELFLLLARMQTAFFPGNNAADNYIRSVGMFRDTIKKESSKGKAGRNDVIISSAIRLAEIGQERAGRTPTERQRAAVAALKELAAVEHLQSDQREIVSHLLYTKANCMFDAIDGAISPEKCRTSEVSLLHAADCLETMRDKLATEPVFENIGSFFSQRTHVYEALSRLYAATQQPEKMLAAVERMKARAFRDLLGAKTEPDLDVVRMRERLKTDNAGLVEFFYGPDHAWALWISPQSAVEIMELAVDGQTLVTEMQKVACEFAKPRDRRAWLRIRSGTMRLSELETMRAGFQAAHTLHGLLARPFEEKARSAGLTRLYVVPHHLMNYLSFDSLITELDKDNPLASKFRVQDGLPVTFLPSAAVLSIRSASLSKDLGSASVFARSDFRTIAPTFPADLDGTITEAKMVADATSASLFCEGDATETRLRGLSGPFRLLYFATHGVLNARRPLDSAILLTATDDKNTDADGRVTVEELVKGLRGRLPSDLVVLSACHTNEGEPNPTSGDDLAALSRGFMAAGARSVLATQWEASDATFPEIMRLFLDSWANQGLPKDEALSVALRTFLNKNDFPVWRHPHFWAPMVLVGGAK